MPARSILDVDLSTVDMPKGTTVADPFKKKAGSASRRLRLLPSQWASKFIKIKGGDTGTVLSMDFSERKYLQRPYDTGSKKILLMTSRQTEKCVAIDTLVSLPNGRLVEAGSLKVGDYVATMTEEGKIEARRIVWVSPRRRKPSVRIETRQGHIICAATTHPMRAWDDWKEAGALTVGDRLAAVRRCGEFSGKAAPSKERIRLTAYLIGDGGTGSATLGFTNVPGPRLEEVKQDIASLGGTWRTYKKTKHKHSAIDLRFRHLPVLKGWLKEDSLLCKSAGKRIPAWVFDLSEADTALFLNRLWSTDGHVSQRTRSNYNIAYCSISLRLVEQVQALLWKFGIPSRIRKNWPSIYKKRGQRKFAYILNVETKAGITRFLNDVGALGKSENVPLPECDSNNNLDTFPIEIQELITRIIRSGPGTRRSGLFSAGLGRVLSYPPTYDTLRRYVDTFRKERLYDSGLIDELEQHIDSDLYWDRIKKITKLKAQECVDFEVEGTHNFVAAGLVTHNSTTLGNKLLANSAMRPMRTSLFVTPSAMQTKVFSNARLADIIDISPLIRGLTHKSLVMNILEKEFANKSKIYLRYAFLSADRIRGLSVNDIFVDEIQDMLWDLMPVIEESSSHHKERLFVYSGTPKTFDNTIENYWSKHSTQSEWVIPCEHHGTPNRPDSWHWNVLGVKNIGKFGPICDRCGHKLNPEHQMARWVEMNPGLPGKRPEFEGFRICRLMVPWYWKPDPHKENPHEQWDSILADQARYPTAQFLNEVMALSYDSGQKPLSRAEIMRLCDSKYVMDEDAVAKLALSYPLFMGLDWGTGEGGSYTVMFVGGYVRGDHNFQIVYAKRYDGQMVDPEPQLQDIERLIRKFRCKRIVADYGMGFMPNKRLTSVFGAKRIHQFQYAVRAPAKITFKASLYRYLVFRTPVMSDVINAVKAGKFRFPSWQVFEKPFSTDMTALRAEYSNTQRMIQYGKPRGVPDDSFHALVYCLCASFLGGMMRPDIMAPMQETGDGAAITSMEDHAIEEMEHFASMQSDPIDDMRGYSF